MAEIPPHDPFGPCSGIPESFGGLKEGHLLYLDADHPVQRAWEQNCVDFLGYSIPRVGVRLRTVYAGVYFADKHRDAIVLVLWLGKDDISCNFHEKTYETAEAFVREKLPGNVFVRYFELNLEAYLQSSSPLFSLRSEAPHEQTVHIGSSLEFKDSNRAGTIAGFVRLQDAKTRAYLPGVYALTCHHVLRGLSKTPHESTSLVFVRSLGAQETLATLFSLNDRIAKLRNDIEKKQSLEIDQPTAYLQRILDREEASLEHERMDLEVRRIERLLENRSMLPDQLDELRDWQKRRNAVLAFDSHLGKVFHTSGLRAVRVPSQWGLGSVPSIVDWGLVELDSNRKAANHMSSEEDLADLKRFFPRDPIQTTPPRHKDGRIRLPVTDKEPTEEITVVKFGRTTGLTCGKLKDRRLIGVSEHPYDLVHAEWVVESAKIDKKSEVFSAPGDSGASVSDSAGDLVGMVFGGNPADPHSDKTFMTPWALLYDDVLRQTGYRMVWLKEDHFQEPGSTPATAAAGSVSRVPMHSAAPPVSRVMQSQGSAFGDMSTSQLSPAQVQSLRSSRTSEAGTAPDPSLPTSPPATEVSLQQTVTPALKATQGEGSSSVEVGTSQLSPQETQSPSPIASTPRGQGSPEERPFRRQGSLRHRPSRPNLGGGDTAASGSGSGSTSSPRPRWKP